MLSLDSILPLATRLASLVSFGSALNVAGIAYYDPTRGGGSLLDNAGDGYGEPLNVIISGLSSPDVLTDDGAVNYARAIGFSEECFGIHLGNPCSANLGDGNGWVNQTIELRQDYGSASIGTSLESLIGGNHFRVWRQNGTLANSSALFLAISKEEVKKNLVRLTNLTTFDQPATNGHDIVPNGYDIGRDALVASAIGETSYGGVSYSTQAQNVTGLLAPGSEGINHDIAQDGIVTVLTVTIA